tara:strand:- start:506 stop:1303 length:798 start_codon:yes stop_codon:yes gene_type:complete
MNKHLIIGKPLSHSLSPKIHNYWFKKNNINGIYEKKEVDKNQLEEIVKKIREKQIHGINVTVPYKQKIIPFLETLSQTAKETYSVNTIYNKNGQIHGDNTDVYGFEKSIKKKNLDLTNKSVFLLGAGGVVPSIIIGLKNLKIGKIFLSNRTQENANQIKKKYNFIELIKWGEIIDCDLFINCTSIGLKKEDKIEINFTKIKQKKIFYDLIYNPPVTKFLSEAQNAGHQIINGKDMLLYQAQKAFKLWYDLLPEIDENFLKYINND